MATIYGAPCKFDLTWRWSCAESTSRCTASSSPAWPSGRGGCVRSWPGPWSSWRAGGTRDNETKDNEAKDNEVFSRSWIDLVCRNCVDALRYLGEAGKCRKLDSQVKKVQLFVFYLMFGQWQLFSVRTFARMVLIFCLQKYFDQFLFWRAIFSGGAGSVLNAHGQHDEWMSSLVPQPSCCWKSDGDPV